MDEDPGYTCSKPPDASDGSIQIMSDDQKERAMKNKQRAIELRNARSRAKPYTKPCTSFASKSITDVTQNRGPSQQILRDSHAGFIFEEESVNHPGASSASATKIVEESVPALPDALLVCSECGKKFAESYLYTKFQLITCDKCRDSDGKHSLITKTEAKQKFLLNDCDFEERNGPPLPFLLKKNPHSSRWGEMKLYLFCQVESRSHELWGGKVGLETEKLNKVEKREKRKEKKYAQDIKNLRRAVRSSQAKPSSSTHIHAFPPDQETHNSDDDTWTKTCSSCGYQVTFEKM